MDPNGAQFSIKDPFDDNANHCPGSPLPRSFTRTGYGRQTYGVSSRLSPGLSPSKSFTLTFLERQVYGVSVDFSINHSHAFNLDPFRLASVGSNSRALLLSTIQENETRILFFLFASTVLQQLISWGKYNYVDAWLSFIPGISNTGMKSSELYFSIESDVIARTRILLCWVGLGPLWLF